MKKLCLFGLTAVLLALLVIGCEPGPGPDTWSDVTSLSEVDGSWKGSFKQTFTMRKIVESTGGTWNSEAIGLFGNDMKITMSMDMTMTIAASASTMSSSVTLVMKFSGSKITAAWDDVTTDYTHDGTTIIVDNAAHSIKVITNVDPTAITLTNFTGVQINQHGTKLRQAVDGDDVGAMSNEPMEIIFFKQ